MAIEAEFMKVPMAKKERVYIYDSTLRDGAQTSGVDFTIVDKQDIAHQLDELGIDYIEGGWPGANPKDDAFFANLPKLKRATLTAFGMTRRKDTSAANDPGLSGLINTGVKSFCIVGKTWDFHVKSALGVSLAENLDMVKDSIAHLVKKGSEVAFDAEHFFDGFKANPKYALQVIKAAYDAGARWIVLCDTNGGTLPHEIEDIVGQVTKTVPGKHLGIHCHNDTGNAIANSLMAVCAGVRQVQGTLNGVGERCGNANLISIIPSLVLKMGFETGVSKESLKKLMKVSRFLDERLNRPSDAFAPYIGEAAFSHKGGLHVSAVAKNPASYEHIDPALVGNTRNILVSDQAGRSNIIARLKEIGLDPEHYSKSKITALIDEIKQRESQGYAYDNANASLEILAKQMLSEVPTYFHLQSFRVIDERRWNAKGELVTISEATAKLRVGDKELKTAADGNGPVNALDQALRNALSSYYKGVQDIRLVDYKVRILTPGEGTGAKTRVMIESEDKAGHRWVTIGVSQNIIDASYNALRDSITWKLMRDGVKGK